MNEYIPWVFVAVSVLLNAFQALGRLRAKASPIKVQMGDLVPRVDEALDLATPELEVLHQEAAKAQRRLLALTGATQAELVARQQAGSGF